MSSFTDPLELEYIDGDRWKLTKAFVYVTNPPSKYHYMDETVWSIKVPEGFITDFASIPRILWNILPPAEHYGKAAVVHDWLYKAPVKWWTRKEADGVFLEAMGVLGTPGWKKYPMWLAVRLFGRRAFTNGKGTSN